MSLIMWQSKKIHCMVKSTMATETLALVDAAEISYWLSNLISELLSYNQDVKIHLPIVCFTQSQQLYDSLFHLSCTWQSVKSGKRDITRND